MKKISAELIRKLREATGAPVLRIKKVLEEVGNESKALMVLKEEGFEKVARRESRETSQGLVEAYSHHSGKIVSVVELFCETDFVARNDLFKSLAHDLALQVASLQAKNEKELLEQEFIKDPTKKVGELVKELIVKTGENIRIGRIFRLELGK